MGKLNINASATPQVWKLIKDTISEAERRGHDAASLLHLLYACANNKVLTSLNVNNDKLKRLLEQKFMSFPNSLKLGNPQIFISNELKILLETMEADVNEYELNQITTEMIVQYLRRTSLETGQLLLQAGATDPSIESMLDLIEENNKTTRTGNQPNIIDIKTKNDSEQPQSNEQFKWVRDFTVDMTKDASAGKYDQVVERDYELDEIVDVLLRRYKNNPLLVGASGVGKTAIIEGFASKLVHGKVPAFKNTRLFKLDMIRMLAGAKYRGDFEERLQGVIDDVQKLGNIILVLENAHILAQNNGEGSMNAGTQLTAALAKGQVRVIATVTPEDMKKYLEKDRVVNSCFQVVSVSEPNVDAASRMVSAVADRYAEYHKIKIEDGVANQAVSYAKRYFTNRKLPDSALDLIDYACAMSKADNLDKVSLTELAIATSRRSGVPVEKLSLSERRKFLQLEDVLSTRVMYQDEPVAKVADALRRSRVGLSDPKRPMGCFLFLGPTGVGKTELAKALAKFLFDDEDALVRVDMSEYMEDHTSSKLIGSPPGYVGYDAGGMLTEAIRRKPYTVVLLDEIEKASTQVLNVFLQAFDDGRITDGQGNTIDCKNVIFIMTSNLGAADIAAANSYEESRDAAIHAAKTYLSPELFNRLDSVQVFKRLNKVALKDILVKRIIPELNTRLSLNQNLEIKADDAVYDYLLDKGFDSMLGARPIKRIVQDEMEAPMSKLILEQESLVDFKYVSVTLVENKLKFELTNEKTDTKKSA